MSFSSNMHVVPMLDVRVMLLNYPCLWFLSEYEIVTGSSLNLDLVRPKFYLPLIYMNSWDSTITFKNTYSTVKLVLNKGSSLNPQFFQCKANFLVPLWTTQLKIYYTIIAQSHNHIIFDILVNMEKLLLMSVHQQGKKTNTHRKL